eukprot:400729-Rhodomonas_salina.3
MHSRRATAEPLRLSGDMFSHLSRPRSRSRSRSLGGRTAPDAAATDAAAAAAAAGRGRRRSSLLDADALALESRLESVPLRARRPMLALSEAVHLPVSGRCSACGARVLGTGAVRP